MTWDTRFELADDFFFERRQVFFELVLRIFEGE